MTSLFLDALHGCNRGRAPVWLMRQAGRYLPSYRSIRERYSFLEMCRTPELAARITLLPVETFGMDAAILFCDILVLADALGVGLRFEEGIGPVIERPLRNGQQVDSLPKPEMAEELGYVGQAIRLLRKELSIPLIGFCGGPFTVASYMIEGGTSRDLAKTKQWMMRDPESFHSLLSHLAGCTKAYLRLQIEAGVQAIQIFDSWAHVLSYRHFKEFSLPYLQEVLEEVKGIPTLLFCRGSSVFASALAEIGPSGISLDWNGDLHTLRRIIPKAVALQGNLDPDLLYAPLPVIQREVETILEAMRGEPGYIFNLGHGVKPDTPVDAVKILVDTVKAFS